MYTVSEWIKSKVYNGIVDTAYRVDEESLKGDLLPSIPVHPIGYGLAEKLIRCFFKTGVIFGEIS